MRRAVGPVIRPLVAILGTADWNAPIATNQHMTARLLSTEFDVAFYEGIGTRRPTISLQDLRRVSQRVSMRSRASQPARVIPAGVTVRSPILLPWHEAPTRAVNKSLLTRELRTWREHNGPRILWTYTPFTYGAEQYADYTVYHLVDLLHENPGVVSRSLLAAERTLSSEASIAIATSPVIGEHLERQGFDRVMVRGNVADIDLFGAVPVRVREPRVVFTGRLSPEKVDLHLLITLARSLAGVANVEVIGPISPEAQRDDWSSQLQRAGIRITPPVKQEELPALIAGAAVGLVPYHVNALTRGVSPLKTYEYLATGLPVVSTSLPSIKPVPDAVWVEQSQVSFVNRVATLVAGDDDKRRAARRKLAEPHGWAQRGEELRGLIWRQVMGRETSAGETTSSADGCAR